jgi:hypothetical protein
MRRFPSQPIAVLNRGINGDLPTDMLARFWWLGETMVSLMSAFRDAAGYAPYQTTSAIFDCGRHRHPLGPAGNLSG